VILEVVPSEAAGLLLVASWMVIALIVGWRLALII